MERIPLHEQILNTALKKNRIASKRTLNERKVAIIKRRILDGDELVDIAKDYRTTYSAIYHISTGKTWKAVQPSSTAG